MEYKEQVKITPSFQSIEDGKEDKTVREFAYISENDEGIKCNMEKLTSGILYEMECAINWIYSTFSIGGVTLDNWLEFHLFENLCAALTPCYCNHTTKDILDMLIKIIEKKDADGDLNEECPVFSDSFIESLFVILCEKRDITVGRYALDLLSMLIDSELHTERLITVLLEKNFLGLLMDLIEKIPIDPRNEKKPRTVSVYYKPTITQEEHEYSYFLLQTFCLFYTHLPLDVALENIETLDVIMNLAPPSVNTDEEESGLIFEALHRIFTDNPEVCEACSANGFLSKVVFSFMYYRKNEIIFTLLDLLAYGGVETLSASFVALVCDTAFNIGKDVKPLVKLVDFLMQNGCPYIENSDIFKDMVSVSKLNCFIVKETYYCCVMRYVDRLEPNALLEIFGLDCIDDIANILSELTPEEMEIFANGFLSIVTRVPQLFTAIQENDDMYEAFDDYVSTCTRQETIDAVNELLEILRPED